MKNFIISLISVFILLLNQSCRCSRLVGGNDEKEPLAITDTVIIVDNKKVDSLLNVLRLYEDSLSCFKDSVSYYRDSIRYEDYINGRRIEKIKYYISVCEKNTNNKKYFFGWIRRAVSD